MNLNFKRSNAFLLEIILNIFIFAILMTVCMQMIIKAHTLSKNTRQLYEAVDICQSLADLFEAGDGDFTLLEEAYDASVTMNNQFHLYLDKNFVECSTDNAIYHIVCSYVDSVDFHGQAIDIVLYDEKVNEVYRLRACHFLPLQGKEEA